MMSTGYYFTKNIQANFTLMNRRVIMT